MNDAFSSVTRTTSAQSVSTGSGSLTRSLGTLRLAVFVIAAVAPLAAVVGVLPVAMVFGSGATLPFAFVIATVVVGLFAVGYSAISREVVVGGAFYAYIAQGLGLVPGLGTAWVAVLSYTVFVPGGLSYLGFVMQTSVNEVFGYHVHWLWFSLGAWGLVSILGYRRIDFSARVITFMILAEFVLLIIFDTGIVHTLKASAFPSESLNIQHLMQGAPGVAILLAFTCYFGIEAAALYSEEVVFPEKSVSRATYLAITAIGVFYFLTSWITVGAIGPDNIKSIPEADVGLIYFKLSDQYISHHFTAVTQAAIVTSMFATILSLHSVASRYMFVLGRQQCLPAVLGKSHPKHGSPSNASLLVSLFSILVIALAASLDIHPMLGLGLVALGFAAVGVMFMQALTSLAIIAYFKGRADRKRWNHVIAPALAFIGLCGGLVMAVQNFEYLSGSQNAMVNILPVGIVIAMVGGMLYGLWMKIKRPQKFDLLLKD